MNPVSLARRAFLSRSLTLGAASVALAPAQIMREKGLRLRLALNAYCFDKPLRAGSMTLEDVVHFCAQHSVDALDATGYYFPGYPKVPPDDYIYNLKRIAFVNGVQISGTGVRNNFAVSDADARKNDLEMIKQWIEVASKLGAPVIRIFSGPARPQGYTFDQALEWLIRDFLECADYGMHHGVVVGLQQHNDFLKTADETIRVIKAVNSPWFGDILDVGSLREKDAYEEIEQLLPYAVSWQLKENVGYGSRQAATDLRRIKAIMTRVGYRGVIPFEAVGTGDPKVTVVRFLEKIRAAFDLNT